MPSKDKLDTPTVSHRYWPFLLYCLVLLVAVLISSIFFIDQLYQASQKPLWLDERASLYYSFRPHSYATLLFKGISNQGSPAPLDYLFCKLLDQVRTKVHYGGLHPYVYYRLWANFMTSISAILAVYLMGRDILILRRQNAPAVTLVQLMLLSFIPLSYLYTRLVYDFAAEMRPYALWNSLYLLVLASCLLDQKDGAPRLKPGSLSTLPPQLRFASQSEAKRSKAVGVIPLAFGRHPHRLQIFSHSSPPKGGVFCAGDKKTNWVLFVFLVLLALTATTALFQVGLLLIAFFVVHYLEDRDFKVNIISSMGFFGLPLCICLYYVSKAKTHNYYGPEWGTFAGFTELWFHEATIVPLMLVAMALCFFKKENRRYALCPLGFLLLYLIGPLIYWLTRQRGYFYTDRQYIYYELTNAVFLLVVIKCLPAYFSSQKLRLKHFLILGMILVIGCTLALRPKFVRKFRASIQQTKTLFKDPSQIRYQQITIPDV